MNIEDIKVGEMYNIRVKVDRVDTRFNAVFFTIEGGNSVYAFGVQDRKIHDLISPLIDVKGVCPPPKYDPCRKFRKGDKVRVVEYKGRKGSSIVLPGTITTVDEGEEDCDWIYIRIPDDSLDSTTTIDPAYLELITPVEEMKPYSVHETDYLYRVMQSVDGGEQVVCEYRKNTHPHVKEAAEAECDRLNAEHRKELK